LAIKKWGRFGKIIVILKKWWGRRAEENKIKSKTNKINKE
jgi:hypothetical protein